MGDAREWGGLRSRFTALSISSLPNTFEASECNLNRRGPVHAGIGIGIGIEGDGPRSLDEAAQSTGVCSNIGYTRVSARGRDERLPPELRERVTSHFRGLVDASLSDVDHGRVSDGPAPMRHLREQLEVRRDTYQPTRHADQPAVQCIPSTPIE